MGGEVKPQQGFWDKVGSLANQYNPATLLVIAMGGRDAKELAKQGREAHAKEGFKEGEALMFDAEMLALNHVRENVEAAAKGAVAKTKHYFSEAVSLATQYMPPRLAVIAMGGEEARELAKQAKEANKKESFQKGEALMDDAERQAIKHIGKTVKAAANSAVTKAKHFVTGVDEVSEHGGRPITPAVPAVENQGQAKR